MVEHFRRQQQSVSDSKNGYIVFPDLEKKHNQKINSLQQKMRELQIENSELRTALNFAL